MSLDTVLDVGLSDVYKVAIATKFRYWAKHAAFLGGLEPLFRFVQDNRPYFGDGKWAIPFFYQMLRETWFQGKVFLVQSRSTPPLPPLPAAHL